MEPELSLGNKGALLYRGKPLLLDLSGAVDRLDKLPQRIRGKRHPGIRISYDLVGFIPEEELLKQETA